MVMVLALEAMADEVALYAAGGGGKKTVTVRTGPALVLL